MPCQDAFAVLVRQWVVSLSMPPRWLLAKKLELVTPVLQVVVAWWRQHRRPIQALWAAEGAYWSLPRALSFLCCRTAARC